MVTTGGGYPQPMQPLSPQQQLLLQQQAADRQRAQQQAQQQQAAAAQAASQADVERIQAESETIAPSPTGVRIYNPRTGRAEVGLYNVERGTWVPASSVTYADLQRGTIGLTRAVIMRPVQAPPSQPGRPPSGPQKQPVEAAPWERPFKATGLYPIGVERTPAVDVPGEERRPGSERIVYGEAWVVPWSTTYVVEPGFEGEEHAVTQHGQPLPGHYDPSRGVMVLEKAPVEDRTTGALSDIYKGKIGGEQYSTGGGHTLEELWSRRVPMPAATAATSPAPGVDLLRIFTDPRSLFYFNASHGATQIDWAGQRATVDTLSKGMFEHGASVMGGAHAIANAMPRGVMGSAAGAVVTTAAGFYATPFMAIGAGGMLMEIAAQHPGTVGQVLLGTPGFMVQSHAAGYAENPTRAAMEDLLMLGIIGYAGARAAGVRPVDIARAGKFREFGEYLYSDTSAQLGGRAAPRTRTIMAERSAVEAPVRSIDLTKTIDLRGMTEEQIRSGVMNPMLGQETPYSFQTRGLRNDVVMSREPSTINVDELLKARVDEYTIPGSYLENPVVERIPVFGYEPEPAMGRGMASTPYEFEIPGLRNQPRTTSRPVIEDLVASRSAAGQAQRASPDVVALINTSFISGQLQRSIQAPVEIQESQSLSGQLYQQEARQQQVAKALSGLQSLVKPRSVAQSLQQSLYTPRTQQARSFIETPGIMVEQPRTRRGRPRIDIDLGDLLEPPRRRKKGAFARVWINPSILSGPGHAPVTIKKPRGLSL